MIRRWCLSALVVLCAMGAGLGEKERRAAPLFERVADVRLPGAAVRFDYMSADTSANRLYISHMDAGELVVFDLKGRKVAAVVRDVPRITGVWSVPALGKIYASVTGYHQVVVIDATKLRIVGRVG